MCFAPPDHHANAKVWVFTDSFCSHFNARGFQGFTNRAPDLHVFAAVVAWKPLPERAKDSVLIVGSISAALSWLVYPPREEEGSFLEQRLVIEPTLIDPPFWGHLNIELYFSFLF